MVEAKDISHVTVIGVSKLRDNYKPYEAKRKLCASYDMFLADDRVVPLLPRLLGKKFYETKKYCRLHCTTPCRAAPRVLVGAPSMPCQIATAPRIGWSGERGHGPRSVDGGW